MSLIKVLAMACLIFLALSAFWDTSSSDECTCPHPKFIDRHICSFCNDLNDASIFAQIQTKPTGRLTMFFGHAPYEKKTYKACRCGNTVPVPAAQCTKDDDGRYECSYLGQKCVGEHDADSGHLFFREIQCN